MIFFSVPLVRKNTPLTAAVSPHPPVKIRQPKYSRLPVSFPSATAVTITYPSCQYRDRIQHLRHRQRQTAYKYACKQPEQNI